MRLERFSSVPGIVCFPTVIVVDEGAGETSIIDNVLQLRVHSGRVVAAIEFYRGIVVVPAKALVMLPLFKAGPLKGPLEFELGILEIPNLLREVHCCLPLLAIIAYHGFMPNSASSHGA